MDARLYVFPGSHPAMIGRLMLEHKGIAYKRTDLLPVISKVVVRALGFPGATVPALKIDGRRVQGSRAISRELDRIQPDPPLFPSDPSRAGGGRGGRALRRRAAAAAVPPDSLLGDSKTSPLCAATRRERSSASRSAWR